MKCFQGLLRGSCTIKSIFFEWLFWTCTGKFWYDSKFLWLYLLFFLASWSMGSVGSFWTWNNWPIKGTGLLPWAKRAGLYNQNRYSYWIWIFGPILVQLGPILVQLGPILAHFVTGVGLSNLTVMITFRNVLRAKVSGFYFSKLAVWARFGPDLAQIMSIWPNLSLV